MKMTTSTTIVNHLLAALAIFALSCANGEPEGLGTHEQALRGPVAVEVEPEPGAAYAQQVVAVLEILPDDVEDRDGDGFAAGVDHDDGDRFAFPGAPEVPCDELDQDGDGVDPCPPDVDGDGARSDRDCDDLDASIGPLAVETFCNGRDENCDGFDSCDQDRDGADDLIDTAPLDPAVSRPELADDAEALDADAP